MNLRSRITLAALTLAVGAALPAAASATVTAPQVVAGPDPSIVEIGGAALASDGTGGVVFRKVDASGSHIWVTRVSQGKWTVPQRVDWSLPYDSVRPRIAAGLGGRLLVIWVQEYAHRGRVPVYRLQSATLAPGGRLFQAPLAVASDIAGPNGLPGANAADPSLEMNDLGVAYLAYRSVQSTSTTGRQPSRPGDTVSLFKVARYVGGIWSGVGTANRNTASTVPQAVPGNGPQVSVDLSGNGIVGFLEPDDGGVERIWARRLYATRLGVTQQISPSTLNGQPLRGDADAFALDGGGLGSGSIVFRQQPGLASPLPGTRMMVARITPPPSPDATAFGAAAIVSDDGAGLTVPSLSADDHEDVAVAYASGGKVLSGVLQKPVSGTLPGLAPLGPTAPPVVAAGTGGATVTAWPTFDASGVAGVAVHQVLPSGKAIDARLAGVRGGPISDLRLAGSGLGDAIVAFIQGDGPDAQVVGATVRVPPQPFVVTAPDDWTKPGDVRLIWDRPASADGAVKYTIAIDGHTVATNSTVPIARLPKGGLDDGRHEIVVRAVDASGETTDSDPVEVLIDAHAPTVDAKIDRARNLTLKVADDLEGKGSGVDRGATRVTYGDGTKGKGSKGLRHRYKRPGRYRVSVQVTDEAGNRRTSEFRVTA